MSCSGHMVSLANITLGRGLCLMEMFHYTDEISFILESS
jgi:hypothetical protein